MDDVVENFLELVDIDDIIITDKYANMVDISVEEDESFILSNGIVSHNSAETGARKYRDPQTQGMFKLKGKFTNTRKLNDKKIVENKEALNLMSAIGLTLNEEIIEEDLRFNEIIFCCDADTDGDSITALLLNFFSKWKGLFDTNRIYKCLTPLLVVKKGKNKDYVYTSDEWEEYQKNNSLVGCDISYKKGLGSLSDAEYKEMIQNPRKVAIRWDGEAEENLECWFGIDSEPRKKQLRQT